MDIYKMNDLDFNNKINLKGLSGLVNKNVINQNVDAESIEKSILGNVRLQHIKIKDPSKEFEEAIRKLDQVDTLNNPSDDLETPADPEGGADFELPEAETMEEMREDIMMEDSVTTPTDYVESYTQYGEPKTNLTSYSQSNSTQNTSGFNNLHTSSNTSSYSNSSQNQQSNIQGIRPLVNQNNKLDEAFKSYIGSDIDKENEHEEKENLLLDIEDLRDELATDNVDLSRIEEVNQMSDINKVRKIHRILQNKRDKKRFTSFGNELILGGAQLLEYVFDGNTKIGPFQPDITGWHNSVRPKLRRMRSETAGVVSNIVHKYDIGPIARIFIELVPSLFIHANMRKNQKAIPGGGFTRDQVAGALDDLKNLETS